MKPEFLDSFDAVLSVHGEQLRSLPGRRLTDVRIVWDQEDDSWFADEPVVMVFDDVQLEIVFWKLNELSISWNAIDLEAKPNWFGSFGDMDLQWRQCQDSVELVGKRLTELSLIEHANKTGLVLSLIHI